jgi:hypothetical protein
MACSGTALPFPFLFNYCYHGNHQGQMRRFPQESQWSTPFMLGFGLYFGHTETIEIHSHLKWLPQE